MGLCARLPRARASPKVPAGDSLRPLPRVDAAIARGNPNCRRPRTRAYPAISAWQSEPALARTDAACCRPTDESSSAQCCSPQDALQISIASTLPAACACCHAQYFHLNAKDACVLLHISMARLKRSCRVHGISRWPHRKLASLHNLRENIQAESNLGSGDRQVRRPASQQCQAPACRTSLRAVRKHAAAA